jgi:hypothetical protein
MAFTTLADGKPAVRRRPRTRAASSTTAKATTPARERA